MALLASSGGGADAGPRHPDSAALLIQEYRHLTDSLLRCDERGERRAEWFITFAAASVLVLIAARAGLRLSGFAIGVVLLFGLITRAWIIHRNLTADEYEEKIRGIEQFFVVQDAGVARYLPYPPRADGHWRASRHRSIVTGGALQTVEFVNSLTAGVLVALLPAVIYDSETVSIVAVALGAVAVFAFQFLERWLRTPRSS